MRTRSTSSIPAGVTGCNVPVAITVTNGTTVVVSNFGHHGGRRPLPRAPVTASYPPGFVHGPRLQGASEWASSCFSIPLVRPSPPAYRRPHLTTFTLTRGEPASAKVSSNVYTTPSYDLNYGTCAITNTPPTGAETSIGLDAGPVLNVNGPNGAKQVPVSTFATGSLYGALGGRATLPGQTAPPLTSNPGTCTPRTTEAAARTSGGFKVNMTVPAAFTWTNYSSITSVTRSQVFTVNWTGGDPSWDVYLFGGSSVTDNVTVSFECRAHNSDQTLTVPVSILEALRPAGQAAAFRWAR